MTAPALLSAGVGDVVSRRHSDGRVDIVRADPLVYVSVEFLDEVEYHAGLYFDGTCLVMGGVVWYRPVLVEFGGQLLLCAKVRDERPEGDQ